MKFPSAFVLFVLVLQTVDCQVRNRWKRPLQAITSKLSGRLSVSNPQLQYVNLSEQGIRPNGFVGAAVAQDVDRSTKPNHPSGRHHSGQLIDESGHVFDEWDEPEVVGNKAQSRHSSLIATRVIPNDINHVYRKSMPTASLYRMPIYEQDSYLEALELSRLPCQTLEDPDDCYDSTQLLRQRPVTPPSKKLLATIRILVNFHNHRPKHQ
ncbi:uncharacterized protein LOC130692278 [Daphnia carinata]|uniref:uncharacterized protein LOC130692278 n=1 Tax=Daphnia carinata TaxID=120202 RepID=UPI002579A2A6|nr:uncharacterized protein LOC130692278 [Daphnia carinata]